MSEPTNKELMHYIKDIQDKSEQTLAQVKYTNGRVGKLERWQSFIQGGLAVLTILVVPILIFIITHWK